MGYDLRRPLVPGVLQPLSENAPGVPFVRGGEIQRDVAGDGPPSAHCWPGLEREWAFRLGHHEAVRAIRQCPDCGSDVRILRTAERPGDPPTTTVRGKCRLVRPGPDGLVWSSLRRASEHDLGPVRSSEDASANLDVLLDAMSLIGRGSMLQARRLVNSMSPDTQPWIADNAVRLFESLGHVEIERDPSTNQQVAWFITPPTLMRLSAPGQWVLCGFRSRALLRRLREKAEMLGCSAVMERRGTMSTMKITSDSMVRIEVLLRQSEESTGIALRRGSDDFSRFLVAELPSHADLARRLPRAPRPSLSAPTYIVRRGRWDPEARAKSPLRRVSEFPRRYVIQHGGISRYVDVRTGKYLAAAAAGVSYLRYDEEREVLSVMESLELPSLFERVAVMCSGEIPHRNEGVVHYASVPGDIAQSLSEKLEMSLERPA